MSLGSAEEYWLWNVAVLHMQVETGLLFIQLRQKRVLGPLFSLLISYSYTGMWENSWPKACLLIRFWWQNNDSQRTFAARSLEIKTESSPSAQNCQLLSACSLFKADLWWLQKRCLLQDACLKIRSKINMLSCIISSSTSRCWNHQLRTSETCPLWQGLAD